MFHDQKESIFSFYDFIKLNDMGMPHNPENMNLARHSLNIIHVVNLPFVKYFDGNLLACKNVISLFDFAKGTLTQCLLDLVISDEFVAHVYNFLVLLTLNWHFNLSIVDTVLKLDQAA